MRRYTINMKVFLISYYLISVFYKKSPVNTGQISDLICLQDLSLLLIHLNSANQHTPCAIIATSKVSADLLEF